LKPDIRARVGQLRARIGASPVIGSEIERRPLHDYRYWGDVFRIRELEARLVEIGRSGLAYWGLGHIGGREMNQRERTSLCRNWSRDGNFERVAEVYELTVADAVRLIDEECAKAATAEQIRRDIFSERLQLIELKKIFFERALNGEAQAVEVFCKLGSRLASLLGLDAPRSTAHLVAVASAPALDQHNAQRMLELFDRLSYDPLYGGKDEGQDENEPAPN
jgi:hypothetical protein